MQASGKSMQKSIEVEYWVVDRDGALTTPGPLTADSEYLEEEFVRPLFELKTPPCETFVELRETFLEELDGVLTRADELDKLLVPTGTPLNGEPIERWGSDRGRIQQRVLGDNFAYAKYCAGTHLHFEKRNVTDQLNVLASLDPALALLNSSPFFRGERIADGARALIYRRKCYEEFPMHGQLWGYVETVGEWERRLQTLYDEFKEAAVQAGVDTERVDATFSPDDVVWTPVRLRDQMPTVEWRSADAALPSQILRLAREMGVVMERLHHTDVHVEGDTGAVTDDGITLPAFETVRDYTEQAIDEGLGSTDVATYLERMGFDVHGYDPLSQDMEDHSSVSPETARELRLRYGRLLRLDVEHLLEE